MILLAKCRAIIPYGITMLIISKRREKNMPLSVWHPDIQDTLENAKQRTSRQITLDGQTIEISPPFPSPQDWRDSWIYFLMVDRFNNPTAPPRQLPSDS